VVDSFRPMSSASRFAPAGWLERLTSTRALTDPARAAFVGVVPLMVVDAAFWTRRDLRLGLERALALRLYDVGQLLGLATLVWLVQGGLQRLPASARQPAGALVSVAALFVVLDSDFESFVERHGYDETPWRLCFALLSALAIAGAFALVARLPLGPWHAVPAALGLAAVLGNHRVIPLDYPGAHFVVAAIAAVLMGASAAPWLAAWPRPRVVQHALVAASALSLLSFVIMPGPVVRSILVQRSGAVAAPFVARLWTLCGSSARIELAPHDASWWGSRAGLPEVPAERLEGAPAAPIVVLLTIDALRGDVLTDPRAKSSVPGLRAMAKHGARFDRVWSPAAYTMASLRSLFFGAYFVQQEGSAPARNRRELGQPSKVRSRRSLASLLHKRGVVTVNVRTQNVFANTGPIARGFREDIAVGARATAKAVVSALLKRLRKSSDRPMLLYAHVLDTHAPYDLGGRRGSAKKRYLGEVAFVDAQVDRLRRELRERGLHDRTYLIVTSDHGEAFGEHGRDFHATTMYQEMIHIPLLIEGPGIAPRRIARHVTLIDVGPTVLSLFGRATPASFMGESLQPFLRGENPTPSRPLATDGGRALRAMLFDERWKAIVDMRRGTEEVYDLQQDSGERLNLAERPEVRPYVDTVYAFFRSLNPPE
jgi:arylsulfatase A-like enzyme